MIQTRTELKVTDNSGAKKVMCIKVLGGSKKQFAYIGDVIKVSVKTIISNSKIKKGSVMKALIIRTKKGVVRKDGFKIKFDNNACILINELNLPIGTRVFGPVTREIKNKKFAKIISLAKEVL